MIQEFKSKSGSTTIRIYIAEVVPVQSSLASLICLNNYYAKLDEYYLTKKEAIQIYLDRRHVFLEKELEACGNLTCHYCHRPNLEIGERFLEDAEKNNKNPNLATVDHKVPVSSGIDKLDESNWLVSCKKCNQLKGSMTYEDFLKSPRPKWQNKKKKKKKKYMKMKPLPSQKKSSNHANKVKKIRA